MTDTYRRVPYAPDPDAEPYHAAYAYAQCKGSTSPAEFGWWFVDHCGQLTVSDAWRRAPDDVKAT